MTKRPVKSISIKSVVLMMMTACLSIRWIAVAGSIGPAAIIFWLVAVLLFFIPLSLIVIEFSLNHFKHGSIAAWTEQGLGKSLGFFSAWFYWINNVVFYPSLLAFIAANFGYLIGADKLANNSTFIVTVILISFWLAVLLNIAGTHLITRLIFLSGLFNFRLGVFILIAGVYAWLSFGHSATDFSLQNFVPHSDLWHSLSSLSILMFALAGVEVIPTVGRELHNSEKSLAKAIFIGGSLLIILYIFGTLAINVILAPNELTNTTGVVASLSQLTARLHWSEWIARFIIISLMIVDFGSLNLWLSGSSIIFFEYAPANVLPDWLKRLNRNYVPANALIFQGVLVTIITLSTKLMPTVNVMYMILVLMATIIYFIPYVLLSLAYLKLRRKNHLKKTILSKRVAILCAWLTIFAVGLGISLALIPNKDIKTTSDFLIYEGELIGGPVVFALIGAWLYLRGRKKQGEQKMN